MSTQDGDGPEEILITVDERLEHLEEQREQLSRLLVELAHRSGIDAHPEGS